MRHFQGAQSSPHPGIRIVVRQFLLLLLTSLTFVRPALGGVDFSQSKVAAQTPSVPAGSVATVEVVLKNSGDSVSESTDLRIRFPHEGFLVRIDEQAEWKHDVDEREVTASVQVPAGGEYRFSFDLLAPRGMAGSRMTTGVEVRNFWADARYDEQFSLPIDSEKTNDGVVLGGLRFHPAAFWLLGWMAFGAMLYVWLHFRVKWVKEHPQSTALAGDVRKMPALPFTALLMIPIAFLMVFAGMAWRDFATLTRWKETQAMILDRRHVVTTASRTDSHGVRRTSSTQSPEFALKYQVGDKEIISSGFDTGSSIRVGGKITGKSIVDEWIPGKTIACWYDPDRPHHVVVRRGFGGAYIFALLPLPILWFGVRLLRKLNAAVRQLREVESAAGYRDRFAPFQ